jgi:hypothetical protein
MAQGHISLSFLTGINSPTRTGEKAPRGDGDGEPFPDEEITVAIPIRAPYIKLSKVINIFFLKL